MQINHSAQVQGLSKVLDCTISVQKTFTALASFSSPVRDSNKRIRSFQCFPSVKTLSSVTGFSVRTIHYHLSTLKMMGIISIRHQYRIDPKTNQARQTSSLYRIVVSKLVSAYHRVTCKLSLRRSQGVDLLIAVKPCTPSLTETFTTKSKSYSNYKKKINNQSTTLFNYQRLIAANKTHEETLKLARESALKPSEGLNRIATLRQSLGLKGC